MSSTIASAEGREARLAGALYLVVIVCGIGSEVFVRGNLIVPSDAHATALNILESQGLFRLGFVADAVMALSDVALAVLLYILLAPAQRTLALMAMAFRLIQAAIIGMNLLHYYEALLVLHGSELASGFNTTQVEVMTSLALRVHSHGYDLGLLFFGVNSVLMGFLLFAARGVPKSLGALLAGAGGVYLLGSTLLFIAPALSGGFEFAYVLPVVAEVSFCGWLLAGARSYLGTSPRAAAQGQATLPNNVRAADPF